MNCRLCGEKNTEADHVVTERHRRNQVLFDYSKNRKQFSGNRKGIAVSCDVRSSYEFLEAVTDGKIKISIKPKEEIKFYFTVKNESNKEEIYINFINLTHSRFNFKMNDHGLSLGSKRVLLKPKTTYPTEISVKFQSAYVGQYDMPVIFSFYKQATKETVLIMRDLMVFVEDQQMTHEVEVSPYALKEVKADIILKTTLKDTSDDLYRIPKRYKNIYASGLKKKKNYSQDEKNLQDEIRGIFATGVTEENYIRFFHNLLWYEETIVRINLRNYNMSGVTLKLLINDYALVVPGLGEKRPSLMLGDRLYVRPHDTDKVMFEAIVHKIEDNVAFIRNFHPDFYNYYSPDALFDIRFFMSRLTLERMHTAVNCVTDDSSEQRRVFPKANKNIRPVKPILNYYNILVETNPEQRSAVEHILAGTSGTAPYLVHGPPGTGKTVTIVEAILQLVTKDPMNRIMVCTDSNMAADHVATLIMKYLHMFPQENMLLRSNSKFRVWETMPASLKPYSNGSSFRSFEPISINDFKCYNIVITTLSHAAKFAKEMRRRKIDRFITHLFIDEAAQASEPSCLIPICGLLAPNGSLVLAGDPQQLGPVIISHDARRIGLGVSFMERLKKTSELYSDERNDANYIVMLRNNFRSNPDILKIPNELFYNGQLTPMSQNDEISTVNILGEKPTCRAIVFHGVLSKEQRMGKSPSYFNDMEVELVQQYINNLVVKHHVLPEDIGVVTPYIRQVYKIKNWLDGQSFGQGNIEVGTVEAFQGKEKRIIIISTVRANCALLDYDAKYQLGFLVDDKRFNVAITRAKAKVIIIGNPLCLMKDAKWRAVILLCRELGTYYGYQAEDIYNDEAQKDFLNAITPALKDLELNSNKKK